jgi:hypothetical protein
MRLSRICALASLPLACVAAFAALAQGAPPRAEFPGAQPVYDPAQLPSYSGRVQLFTLTPRGDIDGLILTDGTEVKTPPHLSTSIAYSVRLGDTVNVHGLRAAALPLIQAVSITDQSTGRTVVDTGPLGPPGPPPPPGPAAPLAVPAGGAGPLPGLVEAQGRIRMPLHGPQGEVNGALLEDGTVLRLPPPAAMTFAALLQAGQTIVAEGLEWASPLGKVMEVRQIGPSRAQLNWVAAAAVPRGKKHRPRDAWLARAAPPGPMYPAAAAR